MKQSAKHIWITVFSLFAMLISGYVSSAPIMAFNGSQDIHVTSQEHSSHHAVHQVASSHSINTDSVNYASSAMNHCGESGSSVDSCCLSVCSNVSYPLEPSNDILVISASLAPHHSFTIGDKVTRIQSLLRPPSI